MALPVLAAAAPAAVNAAGNIVGSLISNRGNRKSQERANKYNVQMYNMQRADAISDRDLSRAWSLSDWDRENEYNSPEAQMSRYRDAGLNPNLIYGEGVSASSGQTQAPDIQQTRSSSPGTSQAARYNMDFGMNLFSQNMLLQAQAKKLEAETENIQATTEKTGAETNRINTLLPLEADGQTINIERAKADIDRISSEILLNSKDLDVRAQQLLESDARIRKMFNDTLIARMQLENAIAQTEVSKGQLGAHNRQISLNARQTDINEATLDFEKKKARFDGQLRSIGVQSDRFSNVFKGISNMLMDRSRSGSAADVYRSPSPPIY